MRISRMFLGVRNPNLLIFYCLLLIICSFQSQMLSLGIVLIVKELDFLCFNREENWFLTINLGGTFSFSLQSFFRFSVVYRRLSSLGTQQWEVYFALRIQLSAWDFVWNLVNDRYAFLYVASRSLKSIYFSPLFSANSIVCRSFLLAFISFLSRFCLSVQLLNNQSSLREFPPSPYFNFSPKIKSSFDSVFYSGSNEWNKNCLSTSISGPVDDEKVAFL